MNIGDRFFCSSCMIELKEEGKCEKCGYDPSKEADSNALEEGTLLQGIRFQIGALLKKTGMYYIYGAYDYLWQRPVYIYELYPNIGLERRSDTVYPVPEKEKEFDEIKMNDRLFSFRNYEMLEYNNTVYHCIPAKDNVPLTDEF